MSVLDRCITGRRVLFTCALALGAGCQVYSQPAPAAPVVTSAPAPVYDDSQLVAPPAQADAEVVYEEPETPVVDIETYPSIIYLGVPTYYVGGRWYRQGPSGWGYYRQEPRELGRQREAHEHDDHWQRAREAPIRRQDRQERPAPAFAPQRPQERQPETRVPERMAPPPQPVPQPHVQEPHDRVAPTPHPAPPQQVQPLPARRNPAPVKHEEKEPEKREPRR